MKKKLLIFSGIAVILFGGLWFYARSDDFSRRIRPAVAVPLEKALGPGARIGLVKANLFPLYLEVRDIAIPSGGSAAAIAIRRVRVYLNPFPLLYRTVSLSSVMVQEPIIEVHRGRDGTIDLQEALDRLKTGAAAGAKGSAPSMRVGIGAINVRNAIIRFHDAGSDVKASLSRLNLKSSLGGEGAFSLRVSSGVFNLSVPTYPELAMDLRAALSMNKGSLDLGSLELASETAKFTAQGTVRPQKGEVRLKGKFSLGAGKPAAGLFGKKKQQQRQRLDADWSVNGAVGDPVVEASLRCSDIPAGDFLIRKGALRLSYRDHAGAIRGENWELSRSSRNFEVRELAARLGVGKSGVDIIETAIVSPDASVRASGRIDAAEGYRIAFDLRSEGPGKTLAALSGVEADGPINLQGTLSGKGAAPELDGILTAGPLNIRGVRFQSLSGPVSLRERKFTLQGLSIQQDESRYVLDGSVELAQPEPRYRARLNVLRSDVVGIVALFYKRIPLELSAVGEILFEGTSREFTGRGRLALASGVAYGEPFDSGTLAVDLTSSRVTFTELALKKGDGSIIGTGWIGFDGTYGARITSAGVDLSEVRHLDGLRMAGPFSLDIRSEGSFSLPTVHAEASSGAFRVRDTGLGRAVCALDIADRTMTFTAGVTGENGGQATVQGSMQLKQSYAWSVRTMVDVAESAPGSLAGNDEIWEKLLFTARGRGDLRGEGARFDSIGGNLTFSRLELNQGDYRLANEGEVSLRMERGRISVRSLQLAGTGTKLTVSGSALPGKDVDLLFSGAANLSLFRLFYREVEHADGNAGLTVRIREDWANPDVTGELTISGGQIKIRDVPQKFTAVNGSLSFDRNRIVSEGFSGEVGGGTITVSGSAQVEGAAVRDFSAKALIQGVTVRYPQGLTAVVGGTLFLEGDRSSRMLSGEMIVNRARYEKRVDWKSMLVDVRKGFVPKKKADIGWIGDTQLNIRFSGKESIIFESNLAKIPIEVDMLFRGAVNQPQVLGRIEARKGEVYFRNNVFKILYASADFADPNRINPLLDVQAETRVREYQVRLSVSGTADRAVVTFLSDPPLTDSNILALLTLGRTGEELKGKESGVGVGEATSFMTGKFQDILESRARTLTGLDRFQVDPYLNKTDVSVPRVTVGKEVVQDKVYVTYSSNVGATTPEQLFRIEYILNRNLSLVGERNETGNIGADLKFRFEFR